MRLQQLIFYCSVFFSTTFAVTPPTYPLRYTILYDMSPGGRVAEAYDFVDLKQITWMMTQETKVLNRFDLGQSFSTFRNGSCKETVLAKGSMQTPNFIGTEGFRWTRNETIWTPQYGDIECCVWQKDGTTLYTKAEENGSLVKLEKANQIKWYGPIIPVTTFNPKVFAIPAICP